MLLADPAKTNAALRQGNDPYGLMLKGERPEKILVINVGSSSLKYSFYDTADESREAKGLVERIGLDGTRLKHRGPKGELKRDLAKGDHAAAFKAMVAELTSKETGVISSAAEVSVVAHRIVHGGEKFTEATLITDELLAEMEKLNPLAPLHNPVIIAGIREMRRLFPAVPHVGVFDTAFHHTLPAYAFLYGYPVRVLRKEGCAPLRLSRHVPQLRCAAGRRIFKTPPERTAPGELPPRQRGLAVRRRSRALSGYDDGFYAA